MFIRKENIMKKIAFIIFGLTLISCVKIHAQIDWYGVGYTIGSGARQIYDNQKAKKEEEARQERERQQQEQEYYRQQAERQAEYNRQEAARQAEANRQAEAARQEAERQERARIQEETRQREAREEAAKREAIQEKSEKIASYNYQNAERHILSLKNPVTFISMEGDDIFFMFTSEKKFAYKNTSTHPQKFTSSARIRVKYVGDVEEYSYTDACMINMNKSSEILDLSDMFFDISSKKEIEDIRISFENSKISSTSTNSTNVQPVHEESSISISQMLNGTFSGIINQEGYGEYKMTVVCNWTDKKFFVEYPGLECGGNLIFSDNDEKAAVFIEEIKYGLNDCENGLFIGFLKDTDKCLRVFITETDFDTPIATGKICK